MQKHVGTVLDGRELMVVSGIVNTPAGSRAESGIWLANTHGGDDTRTGRAILNITSSQSRHNGHAAGWIFTGIVRSRP